MHGFVLYVRLQCDERREGRLKHGVVDWVLAQRALHEVKHNVRAVPFSFQLTKIEINIATCAPYRAEERTNLLLDAVEVKHVTTLERDGRRRIEGLDPTDITIIVTGLLQS